MNTKPLTPAEETHLHFLQARYDRLNSDWSYSELCKFTAYLARRAS